MATAGYWADKPMDRDQMSLFSPTLDSMMGDGDPVRLFDELLGNMDWTLWEAEYNGKRGQPPIHPRYVAAGILYGLYRGIRSTRKLEEACFYRVDFIWLLHGFQIDHSTFSKFRTKFSGPLKDLFKQLGRHAMDLGLIRLCEVAFDGTRVKANNGRYATRTAKTLEERLAMLDALFEEMMSDVEANDRLETQQELPGQENSATQLPDGLSDLQQRREAVHEALKKARAADEDAWQARHEESSPNSDHGLGFTRDAEQRGGLRSELHAHGNH